MTDNVHFSSERDDWETPQKFFDDLTAVVIFRTDEGE